MAAVRAAQASSVGQDFGHKITIDLPTEFCNCSAQEWFSKYPKKPKYHVFTVAPWDLLHLDDEEPADSDRGQRATPGFPRYQRGRDQGHIIPPTYTRHPSEYQNGTLFLRHWIWDKVGIWTSRPRKLSNDVAGALMFAEFNNERHWVSNGETLYLYVIE